MTGERENMRVVDVDNLMDSLRGNVLIDVTPALETAIKEQSTEGFWKMIKDESDYPTAADDGKIIMRLLHNGFVVSDTWYHTSYADREHMRCAVGWQYVSSLN